MPNFRLAQTVAGNVRALRAALGSVVRELSREALAELVAERHPDKRPLNTTTVARWEAGESEPDLHSLRIMAELAGVSLEQFAFGAPESDGGTIPETKEAPPKGRPVPWPNVKMPDPPPQRPLLRPVKPKQRRDKGA